MSRHGEVPLPLGDADYTFRLSYGDLLYLESKVWDAGPQWVAEELQTNRWKSGYIRETIRLALITGGKSQSEANEIVTRFVDTHLMDCRRIARAIIIEYILPPKDLELGKAAGVRKRKSSRSRGARQTSEGLSETPSQSTSSSLSSTS